MSDASTLLAVAAGAIALGASSLKLAQYVIHRSSHKTSNGNGNGSTSTVGKLNILALERMLEEAARLNTNERIIPVLTELKNVSEKQVDALQKLSLILVELVTLTKARIQ